MNALLEVMVLRSSRELRLIMTMLLSCLGEEKPLVARLRFCDIHEHSLVHRKRGGPLALLGSSLRSLICLRW